jgi:hypothetical protein
MEYAVMQNQVGKPLQLLPQVFYSPEEATRKRLEYERAFASTGVLFYVVEIRPRSCER